MYSEKSELIQRQGKCAIAPFVLMKNDAFLQLCSRFYVMYEFYHNKEYIQGNT